MMTAPAEKPTHQPKADLRAAIRQLHGAIDRLIRPTGTYVNSTYIEIPGLYLQLHTALAGQQGAGGHSARSMPPVWVDAADMLNNIDLMVGIWQPGHRGVPPTIARLRLIADRKWSPEQTNSVRKMARAIKGWADDIEELFDPTPIRVLWDADDSTKWAACPQCGERHVYGADPADGKPIRKPALQMRADTGETRCINNACGAEWGRGAAGVLCGALGYPITDAIRELCEWLGIPSPTKKGEQE